MTDGNFYEPSHCVMCGSGDLLGQFSVITSPLDHIYVVCHDCLKLRDPAWNEDGFLLYPARMVVASGISI